MPVRRSNSAEHLYDTADSPRNDPRARLPIPDETHAGLYAMVTSRPVDSGIFNGSDSIETADATTQSPKHSKANGTKSASPGRNSLYTKEGLVVTALEASGDQTEEHIVSSADIEHTVSSAGSVYAIVQARPSKKKKSITSDDSPAQSPTDGGATQPPRKPPRSPSLSTRPRLSKGSSIDSPQDTPSGTPDRSSGPPTFPPPPPPKSVTPEPLDEGAYEIISTSSKKPKAKPTVKPKQQNGGIEDGQGYALVSEDHIDSGASQGTSSEPPKRPPHMYSMIQEDEAEDPTVSVRMVSHGYATVVEKGDINKRKANKASTKPKPQPPPPFKRKTEAATSPTHKPLVGVSSSPLLDDDTDREPALGKRTHSFTGNVQNGQNGQNGPIFVHSC